MNYNQKTLKELQQIARAKNISYHKGKIKLTKEQLIIKLEELEKPNIQAFTLKELQEYAQKRGLNYKGLTKAQLLIQLNQQPKSQVSALKPAPVKENTIPAVLLTKSAMIINHNGKTVTVQKDSIHYPDIIQLYQQKKWSELIERVFTAQYIVKKSFGYFYVDQHSNARVTETNALIEPFLAQTLIEFIQNEYPFDALLEFCKKLQLNPSEKSKESLFRFLEHNKMPITNNGNFIAYKKVTKIRNDYYDSYTKKIKNNPGSIVSMDRNEVNPDPNDTCSQGLHVAAWEYAQQYNGDTLIEVEVNPVDVVAVPTDYNNQKMRVCQYRVISVIDSPITEVYRQL